MKIRKPIAPQEEFIELELIGNDEKKAFLKVRIDPEEIWVDFEMLPKTAFLCACHDGEMSFVSKCGENGDTERIFINIDWIIEEWGGDREIIELAKKKKEQVLADLPDLKKSHGIECKGQDDKC